MKTMQNFVEQLTSPKIVDALVEQLLEHMEDFREDHHRYLTAISRLKSALGDHMAPLVDNVVAAIHRRTASDLIFAGALGLKMNLDHFQNPMSPNCTWPQIDFNDYLRENIAHSLPEYQLTETILSDFYNSLTPEQREIYCAITEYASHLETVGPKLAHYYGYLLGDTLLYNIVPGYHPDRVLTMNYNTMLEDYFGKYFLPIAL